MLTTPLVVDLDGTVLCTDMLQESLIHKLRVRPQDLLKVPVWLRQGKGFLKERLAKDMDFDPATLPYNKAVLDFLRREHKTGRTLVLCTGSNEALAQKIAAHLGIFTEVMASTATCNLTKDVKAVALVARYGEGCFDYAGNSTDDLAVWAHARRAIVVNASAKVHAAAQRLCPVERCFSAQPLTFQTLRRGLRLHQWVKNILLFAPCVAAHRIGDVNVWPALLIAFLAFGLCASSVYLLNDLLDLESDRHHPRKRKRPLAAGTLSIMQATLLIPVLLGTALGLGLWFNTPFLLLLMGYFGLTLAYSFVLKRLLLLDCITLAILYTMRIIGGGLVLDIPFSFWLLAFAVFLFLSLAFVKRYAELASLARSNKKRAHGRAYIVSDLPLIQTFGITAAYTSVLVLALYMNSEIVLRLYHQPLWLWFEIPVLIFWVSWLWLQAHRGRMNDDPLLFSLKDSASRACGILFMALLGAAIFL